MGSSSNLQLKVGDHIFVKRRAAAGGYSHHGIYVGEEGGVKYAIHLTSTENKNSASGSSSVWSRAENCGCLVCGYKPDMKLGVIKSCLDCFVSGDSLNVKRYRNSNGDDTEAVKTAYHLLEQGYGDYNLIGNNCEHFATYCKTGYHSSDQVEQVMQILLHPNPIATLHPMMGGVSNVLDSTARQY